MNKCYQLNVLAPRPCDVRVTGGDAILSNKLAGGLDGLYAFVVRAFPITGRTIQVPYQ